VEELIMAGDYIDRHNDKPKPFVWTAKHLTFWKKSSAPAPSWMMVNLFAADH
jgi:hypothetical protein